MKKNKERWIKYKELKHDKCVYTAGSRKHHKYHKDDDIDSDSSF